MYAGPQGPQGLQGVAGDDGDDGVDGLPGPPGAKSTSNSTSHHTQSCFIDVPASSISIDTNSAFIPSTCSAHYAQRLSPQAADTNVLLLLSSCFVCLRVAGAPGMWNAMAADSLLVVLLFSRM